MDPGPSSPFAPEFPPLLNGAESPSLAAQRQRQFEASWAAVETRIQTVLRASNRVTLDAVAGFVSDAEGGKGKRIPAGLIVTGPNIASQELLFSQLAERVEGRFVRLRSAEAVGLKGTLRKIIRDLTRGSGEDGEEEDEGVTVGRTVSIVMHWLVYVWEINH